MLESVRSMRKDELHAMFEAFTEIGKSHALLGNNERAAFYNEIGALCKCAAISREIELEEMERDIYDIRVEWRETGGK